MIFPTETIVLILYAVAILSVLLSIYAEKVKKEKIKDTLNYMMIHELRAPLAAIKDAASFLIDNNDLKELDKMKMLTIIHQQSVSLLESVSSFLDASKLEAGKLTIVKSPTDIVKLIKDQVEVFLPEAKTKQITLETSLPDDLPNIPLDPIRITQVINNLLSNGIKYTQAGGKITITAALEHATKDALAQIVVSVKDTGIGIPKEKQDLVFKKFSQITSTSSLAQSAKLSSGLGLYIVKGIIESHGGHVSLYSEENNGTKVSFSLPIEEAPHVAKN
jgi:signal transduction histidine kinase